MIIVMITIIINIVIIIIIIPILFVIVIIIILIIIIVITIILPLPPLSMPTLSTLFLSFNLSSPYFISYPLFSPPFLSSLLSSSPSLPSLFFLFSPSSFRFLHSHIIPFPILSYLFSLVISLGLRSLDSQCIFPSQTLVEKSGRNFHHCHYHYTPLSSPPLCFSLSLQIR